MNIFLILSVLFFSCQDDTASEKPAEKKYFISAEETADIPLETLKALTTSLGQPDIAALLKYSIKSYTIVYETTFKGEPIQASGLLIIPQGLTADAPIISVQHGTTFVKSDAPSLGAFTGMELFASAGYISLVPDFIGYGKSASVFHPYYDKDHSAFAVVDMIKSAKEFLASKKIGFNEKLFLAGYSEGGYVTLAAAKEIETNPSHNLKLTAVAAGAGGYDLNEMLKGITTSTYYSYPSYLAFVMMSYNNTYNWNKPLNYFFKQQYADALNQYMNGEYGGSFINQKLTTDLNSLFNADFYSRLKQPQGEPELKQALANNSIVGWNTATPIRLYHGSKDEIIPYQNSESTLKSFREAGNNNVTLTIIPQATHGSGLQPMLQNVIPWFLSL
ncbi:alpha/beta hydrolase family protein [Chryseosolibacter indicus]|uniref:alpha/beta hydrolase family protein n=1 Tax=Chryseosolibacter indicus TaxID=2782351 RepID=UPI0020B26C1E|nr:lipase family protein [Chryseosolibacter indicus]